MKKKYRCMEIEMPMHIDRPLMKRQRLALVAVILGEGKLSQKGRGLIEGVLEMLHLIEDHCETIQERNKE